VNLTRQGASPITSDEECVEYARECVRLAGLTKDLQLRDQLFNMAREWMAAAMHEGTKGDAGRHEARLPPRQWGE
jgi:hypothetical protein